jgi:putative ABC transport system permease protein
LVMGSSLYVETPDSPEESTANAQRMVERNHLKSLTITGIVTTGDATDNQVLLQLDTAQLLNNLPDAVSRIEISARTKPEDAFARRDPATLSPAQHEIWYCRPYANSIAYQIQEAIPGAHAEQVRKVEQSEGNILNRISGLMWLISAAALLAAGFAVSAAMATAILERRAEIGLMRSLGAAKSSIALLFYSETGILALIAGTLGYLLGSTLAAWLGARIFLSDATTTNTLATTVATAFNPVLLPVTIGLALLVAIAGSTPSIRTALRLDPANILRSDA